MTINKTVIKLIPLILIAVFFILSLTSVVNKSVTSDEPAHIGAGYLCNIFHSVHLNPEHPPFIKIITTLPLVFLKLNLPDNYNELGQFTLGLRFLFYSGNNPYLILLITRLVLIILTTLFIFYYYVIIKKLFDYKIALFSLLFIIFSPSIIAASHYVTTDIGATIFSFLTIYFFSKVIHRPNLKNTSFAGLFLGLALASKFSTIIILLVIIFSLIIFCVAKLFSNLSKKSFLETLLYIYKILIMIVIAFIVYSIIYIYAGYNDLISQKNNLLEFTAGNYHNAITPVIKHAKTGHDFPQFLFGNYIPEGKWYYFFLAILVKEPIAIQILFIISLMYSIIIITLKFAKMKVKDFLTLLSNLKLPQIFIFNSLVFIIIFLVAAMKTKLNIGIRHILPIFPFVFFLIAFALSNINKKISGKNQKYFKIFIGALIAWYVTANLIVFPHYQSAFNEIAHYGKTGEKYLNDSNLDWGQDLIYLAKWVKKNNIKKIKIDCFNNRYIYYLEEDSYQEWHIDQGIPESGLFAVCKFVIMTSIYNKKIGLTEHSYEPLKNFTPIKMIGNSILIYDFK